MNLRRSLAGVKAVGGGQWRQIDGGGALRRCQCWGDELISDDGGDLMGDRGVVCDDVADEQAQEGAKSELVEIVDM